MKEPRNVLAAVRQALNCNQEEMAGYLDLSRSLVGNAETGKRFLPAEAALKIASLYMLIHQTPVEEEPLPAEPVNSMDIKHFKFNMERQLVCQRKHYAALENGRRDTLHALTYIAAIRQQAAATDTRLIQWLNLLQAKANCRLYDLSPECIALEKLKLQALEAAWQAVGGGEL